MIAFDLLEELNIAGITLTAGAGGKLIAKAAHGVLTPQRREQIAAHKLALLAALDLNRRIRTMALRWNYAAAELVEVLRLARANPEGWSRAVDLDERKFGAGEQLQGMFA